MGLRSLGHNVFLACPPDTPIYHEAQNRGLPVTALSIEQKSLKSLWILGQWLRKQELDVINTHSSTDSWLVALARTLGFYKGSIVRTRHVSAPIKKSRSTKWLYTKGCDFVVTTGEKLRDHVIERVGLPANQVQSIPTGIDIEQFAEGDKEQARRQCNLPHDKVIIGIVATLRSWKGHQYLIEAIAQLNNKDILLLIVGDGPNRPNIDMVIKNNHLEEQVYFAGNQNIVIPWLQAMDLFVLPSYANEGVPQSLMQAMACKLPVISTPVGSIEELIENQYSGLLVPPRSSNELAEAIHNVLDNNSLRNYLSDNGRNTVISSYSLDKMLHNMQGVFNSVV